MIVFSHGGLNAAPIEAAMYAKERGLKVIAITSGENYQKDTATHSSGKKLGDLADILIDNCCPLEDALVAIPGYHQKVGASSTVAVITIAQSIASETALRLEKLGLAKRERSENDRRVIYVSATEKYRALREKAATDVSGYFNSLLDTMAPEDKAMVAEAFQKLDAVLTAAGGQDR